MASTTLAGGAPLTTPAPSATDRHRRWAAQQVIDILTVALARDDAREHPRCPLCGHTRHNEDRS